MSSIRPRFTRLDLLAVAIAALIAFALVGCSGSGRSSTPTGVTNPAASAGGSSNGDDGTIDQGGGNPDDSPGSGDDGTPDQGGGNRDDAPGHT